MIIVTKYFLFLELVSERRFFLMYNVRKNKRLFLFIFLNILIYVYLGIFSYDKSKMELSDPMNKKEYCGHGKCGRTHFGLTPIQNLHCDEL